MTKDLVRRQFGANARNYVSSPVHAKGKSLDRLVALTEPKPDWIALDIATAAGHTALAFAPHVAHVTATDLTPEMISEAQSLAIAKDVSNIAFSLADAEALPFDEAAFDLVTCRIAPHHFPDIPKFIAEVHRVLKPGGRFGLVDNIAPDKETDASADGDDLIAAAIAYNDFERMRDPSHVNAWTHTAWLEAIAGAGLSPTAIEHLRKDMRFDRWCTTMSVDDEIRGQLRDHLAQAPQSLHDFLDLRAAGDAEPDRDNRFDPHGASDIAFTLTELVLIAERT